MHSMGLMHHEIQHSIRNSWIGEEAMPLVYRVLAGNQQRTVAHASVYNIQEAMDGKCINGLRSLDAAQLVVFATGRRLVMAL